ncbi:MAG TPA: hypothetical protein VJO35_15520 [Terriglobales bacterium]|nr:hypothetical protein [Terriglobales bacterium]
MANDQIRETAVAAPYLPFKTFLSSLDPFSQGVPPKIDRSLWNQSGFMQGLIMNAYRFFHLVDVNDKPTATLQQLVKSKNDARQGEIAKLLDVGYPEVMAHDLSTMTPKMLDEQLDRYNVTGDTKKKAATFFLQAAKFAGLPLSNFLTDKIRSTGTKRRRRTEADTENRNDKGNNLPPVHTSGSSRIVKLSEGGTITLTISVDVFSLNKEDREFVFGLIDELQQYENNHPGDELVDDEPEEV